MPGSRPCATGSRRVAGVVGVHDLHVWTIGSGTHALSAHVVLDDRKLSEASAILRSIDGAMRDDFEIAHVTVQFECESCDPDTTIVCTQSPRETGRPRFAKSSGLMKPGTVVLATARTPFGRLGGALASLAATSLGADAIRNAIARAGIDPADVEHVIMGQVLQAGAGQAPARQAAFKAGLAKTTTAETINKVCASGMLAVAHARALHRRRRQPRRGRRRHGVDVERAVSAARRAQRLPLRPRRRSSTR